MYKRHYFQILSTHIRYIDYKSVAAKYKRFQVDMLLKKVILFVMFMLEYEKSKFVSIGKKS